MHRVCKTQKRYDAEEDLFRRKRESLLCAARSQDDETQNGHWNAKPNPKRNQESLVIGLFSFEILKRTIVS